MKSKEDVAAKFLALAEAILQEKLEDLDIDAFRCKRLKSLASKLRDFSERPGLTTELFTTDTASLIGLVADLKTKLPNELYALAIDAAGSFIGRYEEGQVIYVLYGRSGNCQVWPVASFSDEKEAKAWHTNCTKCADQTWHFMRKHRMSTCTDLVNGVLNKELGEAPHPFCNDYTKKRDAREREIIAQFNPFDPDMYFDCDEVTYELCPLVINPVLPTEVMPNPEEIYIKLTKGEADG